jgi:hypothetical protein
MVVSLLPIPHICLGISGLTDDHGFDDFSVNYLTPHMRGAYFSKYRRCDTPPSLVQRLRVRRGS